MTKSIVLFIIMVCLASAAIAVVITEDWETPPYFWTIYNNGILASTEVGATSGVHGYLLHPSTQGDWIPDPTSGLWTGIQGTPSQWIPTTQPIINAINPITLAPYTYDYALSNPANPYERTARLYSYMTGYTGNFWNSFNTSWYAGDVTGGYLISAEPVNLSEGGTLAMTILKLGTGSGSTFLDYATTPGGMWLPYGTAHNIEHAGSDWTPYSIILAPLGTAGTSVYLRVSFRSNVAGGPTTAPFLPLANFWMDDFILTTVVDPTLPVELSSFTAMVTSQYFVELNWTTQSETMVAGYNIFRNSTTDAETASQINLSMITASNTSTQIDYMFTDSGTESGTWYYWLQSNDLNGSAELFGPISVTIGTEQGSEIPAVGVTTLLHDSYPNPFRLKTVIPFQLTEKGNVQLGIYNLKGQLVWEYTRNNADIGMYKLDWNGKDMNGRAVSSGVYYCRMISNDYQGFKKLVLQK